MKMSDPNEKAIKGEVVYHQEKTVNNPGIPSVHDRAPFVNDTSRSVDPRTPEQQSIDSWGDAACYYCDE